jgi:glycosyltransferase involved in cell wall biosynthesis
MSVVFFHQNEVSAAQGGIERYLATLIGQPDANCLLITETVANDIPASDSRLRVSLPLASFAPKWVSFVLGVALASRTIARAINRRGPCTLEFSRPHYILIAWLFRGAKVFTIHGTGPPRSERVNYWVHYMACLLLPWAADLVQVVGRDNRGLPRRVARRMATRIHYVDAWFDDVFGVTPFHDATALRVFFAGRLAPMKNPELLFRIIEAANRQFGRQIEFRYFGGDEQRIPPDLLRNGFPSFGLLNAAELAREIGKCHVGILCSGYGEGSPFIVVETLACGRAFILPPLPGLLQAYQGSCGVAFARDHTVDAYIDCLLQIESAIKAGLRPEEIANGVSHRSSKEAARRILQSLEAIRR